jgi:hypothetical protein
VNHPKRDQPLQPMGMIGPVTCFWEKLFLFLLRLIKMIVYLQSVGRRNGKKNSGLSRRKGQAMHDTPCDNKKKKPSILRGLFAF